jgi:phage terminase small subunit
MVEVYKKKFIEELENMEEEYQKSFASSRSERTKKIEILANKAVEKEKNRLYKRRNQETFAEFYNRIDFKNQRKKWRNGEMNLKYSLKQMIGADYKKDKKQKSDRKKYENKYLN